MLCRYVSSTICLLVPIQRSHVVTGGLASKAKLGLESKGPSERITGIPPRDQKDRPSGSLESPQGTRWQTLVPQMFSAH